jgi:hypothetical protein
MQRVVQSSKTSSTKQQFAGAKLNGMNAHKALVE